jgi:hypothetical protein
VLKRKLQLAERFCSGNRFNKWFRYSKKSAKVRDPLLLPSYLLCYTGSSFGAVSRAKSVLSGADSAGAGSHY